MELKLVIFDFDGTLADTTATIIATYQMTIGELGLEPRTDEQCRATIGLPLLEGFRQLFPARAEERLRLCVETYSRIFYENKHRFPPRLFPGVGEMLARLAKRGVSMSVASSRNHDSLIELCEQCGILQYFELILGADDVVRAKPDPEPVLMTLGRLGVEADRAVVVGDMPVDIAMGAGAGCRTVGVVYGNSSRRELEEAGATWVIDAFGQLADVVSV